MKKAKHLLEVDVGKSKTEMRVLGVKQPMAWYIVNGYKDIENRNNPPTAARVGQRCLIHASAKRLTKAEYEVFVKRAKDLGITRHPKSIDDFEYGAIVGSVIIAGSTRSSRSGWAFRGNCHWLLEKPKRMKPIALKGHQTLFFKVLI